MSGSVRGAMEQSIVPTRRARTERTHQRAGSPVSAERHGFPVCDGCRGPGGGGSTQLTAAQGTRVPDAGGGLQRCAGTAMIALKPGMRRVRNLSSARPVRRGDCACAQFCCRGIGNGDSSHRRLRLSKFSPPGPFFIRACALISKRAWRWCTSERKRGVFAVLFLARFVFCWLQGGLSANPVAC